VIAPEALVPAGYCELLQQTLPVALLSREAAIVTHEADSMAAVSIRSTWGGCVCPMAAEARRLHPQWPVLAFVHVFDPGDARRALHLGIDYLPCEGNATEMAIDTLRFLQSRITPPQRRLFGAQRVCEQARLPSKERDVLRAFARGISRKETAYAHAVTVSCIDKQLKEVRDKLGVGTSEELLGRLDHGGAQELDDAARRLRGSNRIHSSTTE